LDYWRVYIYHKYIHIYIHTYIIHTYIYTHTYMRITTYIHMHISIKICVCGIRNPDDKKRIYSQEYFGYRQ